MTIFFLKRQLWVHLLLSVVAGCCNGQEKPVALRSGERVGGACECCEGLYEGLPAHVDWQTNLAGESERGERLQISGRVYQPDGRTPARGIILYVYHTDAAGHYSDASGRPPRVSNRTPCAVRHGHLRGWMKTDSQGRYQFRTIRPAAYPGRTQPAHIHVLVKEPHLNEYYLSDYLFSDDPLLTESGKAQVRPEGGSGVMPLFRQRDGSWLGKRDIILGLHITNYPR